MKKKLYFNNFLQKLLRTIQANLFVTAFSMPILVHWGLPFSYMTIIGNILFFPFLAIFLLLSSFIFFTELIHIPNIWLIKLLESFSSFWIYLINFGKTTWLLSAPLSHVFLVWLAPAAALLTLILFKKKNVFVHIAILFTILVSTIFISKNILSNKSEVFNINYRGNSSIYIVQSKGKTCVIDPGILGRKASCSRWIEYTFMPKYLQKTGRTKIDHLIILNPQEFLQESIKTLSQKANIKNIYIANIQKKELPKDGKHNFKITKSKIIKLGKFYIKINLKKNENKNTFDAMILEKNGKLHTYIQNLSSKKKQYKNRNNTKKCYN